MTKPRHSEPPPPMLAALQSLNADGNTKNLAFHFLRKDFTKLSTESDFRQAYAGLAACEQLLSPLDRRYSYALSGMRKTLDRFVDGLLPSNSSLEELSNSYKSAREELADLWETVLEAVKPYVPDDLYKQMQEGGCEIFEREY
jgi:hypothetical protein